MTKRALLILVAALAAALAPGAPALATAPERTGWWTTASVSTPVEVVAPIGNDVPQGGLLVQSAADPSSPLAFAALTFEVPEGATVTTLVLRSVTIDGDGALGLCALDRPDFPPADGGAIAAAPGYDCARQLTATPAEDGSYTFRPESLRTGPLLTVAIVPTTALTRVVIAPLAKDALSTRSAGAAAPAAPGAGPTVTTPEQAPDTTAPGLSALPSVAPPSDVAPAPVTAWPQDVSAPVAAPAAAVTAKRAPAGSGHNGLLALALAGAAFLAWSCASASASRAEAPRGVS